MLNRTIKHIIFYVNYSIFISIILLACNNNSNIDLPIKLKKINNQCLLNVMIYYKKKSEYILSPFPPSLEKKKPNKNEKCIDFISLALDPHKNCKESGYGILEFQNNYIFLVPDASLEVIYSYFDAKENNKAKCLFRVHGNIFLEVNQIRNSEYLVGLDNSVIEALTNSIVYIEKIASGGEDVDFLPHYLIYVIKGKISVKSTLIQECIICSAHKYIEIKYKDLVKNCQQIKPEDFERIKKNYYFYNEKLKDFKTKDLGGTNEKRGTEYKANNPACIHFSPLYSNCFCSGIPSH